MVLSQGGFSCLIEEKRKKILFDTGCEGPGLLYNIKKLGYNIKNINALIISHQHWDHTGGLFDVLNLNNKYGKVYAIIGGLHDFKEYDILKNIEILGVCHCTQNINKIKQKFPKQFKEIKGGDIIII